jgi:hypothetical protein
MTTITKDFVRANDIDIHYIDAGTTDAPTLLLHGSLVSTNEIWAPTPISYALTCGASQRSSTSLLQTREGLR